MISKRTAVIVVATVIVAASCVLSLWRSQASVPVDTATVGDLQLRVPGVAVIVPETTIVLTAQQGGTVVAAHAVEGQRVEQGAPILTAVSPELQTALSDASDERDRVQAESADSIAAAEEVLAKAGGELERAEGEWRIADLQFEAEARLKEVGMGGGLSLERARIARERARIDLQVATTARIAAEERVERARGSAKAKSQAAERALLTVREKLEGLTMRAPVSGVIGTSLPRPGELLAAGRVITEINSTQMIAQVSLSPAAAAQVQAGMSATLVRERRSVEVLIEVVGSRAVDGAIQARTSALPANTGWRHDTRAEAVVSTGLARSVVSITRPPGAMANTSGSIYVLAENGATAVRRDVVFGALAEDRLVVLEGLHPGEKVALIEDVAAEIEL